MRPRRNQEHQVSLMAQAPSDALKVHLLLEKYNYYHGKELQNERHISLGLNPCL